MSRRWGVVFWARALGSSHVETVFGPLLIQRVLIVKNICALCSHEEIKKTAMTAESLAHPRNSIFSARWPNAYISVGLQDI